VRVCVCLYVCVYARVRVCVCVCVYVCTCECHNPFHQRLKLPAPMNHVKIFNGWPPRDAPSKLVQLWYKIFPPDQRGQVEMKKPTRLSNTTSTA